MKSTYLGLRDSLLCALGCAALAACGGGADAARTSGASVEAAYAALVGEVAQCAKQVDACLTAATDDAAADQCREEFKGCRESVGQRAEKSLSAAVTACTSKHRDCAKEHQRTDSGVSECKDELRGCLVAAHPQHDDGDAGVDEAEGKGKGRAKDCLADLHSCVDAGGVAADCAHEVRSCVVSALPSADVMAPKAAKDDDDTADEDEAADENSASASGNGKSGAADAAKAADAGKPEEKGKPADTGKPAEAGQSADAGKPADPGSAGKARATEARKCVASFSSCVDAGSAPQSCVAALKECKSAVEP